MLPPIPAKILRSTATVKVCTGTDIYQNQVYETYEVQHVHLQPDARIVKTTTNTEEQLQGTLFVDARRSIPQLNWLELLTKAHLNRGDMRVIIRGIEYTVITADGLRDDSDRLHHWEIGLR